MRHAAAVLPRIVSVVFSGLMALTGACHSQTVVACSADRECGPQMHCLAASKDAAARCAPGPRCASDADCSAPLPQCSSGVCVNLCLQTPAPVCPGGQTCVFTPAASPPTACASLASCGDGLRLAPEACDGRDLNEQTCASLGLGTGPLRCTPGCNFDVSACTLAYNVPTACGDGKLTADEACDGGSLQPQLSCAAFGYAAGGALQCNPRTCQADTQGCFACGDGVLQDNEVCDGMALPTGATCSGLGFDAGTLRCNRACDGLDTSGCQRCGNGVLEGTEVCDGAAFRDSCVNAGFRSGTLTCAADCQSVGTSQCTDWYPLGSSNSLLGVSANLASDGNGASWPSMTFLGDGTPMVVWRDRRGTSCASAHVYADGAWGPLAGALTPNVNGVNCLQNQGRPAVAYSPQEDSVVVAWTAPLQDGNAFVAQSHADGWSAAGDSNNGSTGDGITFGLGGGSSYPAVAVGPGQGHPTVAVWQQDVQDGNAMQVYGRALQSGHWVDLPGGTHGDGISAGAWPTPQGELALPQVAVDGNNTVFVAWVGGTSDLKATLYVRSLSNGAQAWSTVPTPPLPTATQASRQPTLHVDGAGTLWLAWAGSTGAPYGQILVAQLAQDGNWRDAAGGTSQFAVQPDPLSTASSPSLAFDPNNAPVVAYEDDAQVYAGTSTVDDTRQVYLRRFNGAAWVGVDGSDGARGMSRSDDHAVRPGVAWLQSASGDNSVCIAWEHAVSGSAHHQIRALCHAM